MTALVKDDGEVTGNWQIIDFMNFYDVVKQGLRDPETDLASVWQVCFGDANNFVREMRERLWAGGSNC